MRTAPPTDACRPPPAPASYGGSRRLRKLDEEPAPLSRNRLDSKGSPQIGHQPPYDRKPETGAARLRRVEVVEGAVQLLTRHAASRIRDRHEDSAARAARRHGDGPCLAVETVDRVADEVLQNPPDGEFLPADGRQAGRELREHGAGAGRYIANDIAHDGVHVAARRSARG